MSKSLSYREFSQRVHENSAREDRVIKAQMELTYACNLRCRHCYTDCYNAPEFKKREMTLEEITRILREMSQEGILWLNLSGGEVFMHPRFFEIYETAYDLGFILSIYTNGTFFTPETLARLKKRPPFVIDISCHSADEKAFDAFTQVSGSFERFKSGLNLLKESGLTFTLKTKAMTWNLEEMGQIRAFVESFGAEFGYTTHVTPRLDGDLAPLALRLTPEAVRKLDDTHGHFLEEEAECAARKDWLAPPPDNRLYHCACAGDLIHINAFGELGTCTMAYESRVSLRHYSLREAIQKVFTAVRSMRFETASPCRTCEIHAFCERRPTLMRWETGNREAPIASYCDTAIDKARRLTKIAVSHPLGSKGETHV